MIKLKVSTACLAFTTACLVSVGSVAQAPPSTTSPSIKSPLDAKILAAQVQLDRLGFSPGVVDGKEGQSLKLALNGFQSAHGLSVSGELDDATLKLLARNPVPATREMVLGREDIAGPFYGKIPKDYGAQAKMPALGYVNIVEKLAEQFHTSPATLVALNPGNPKLAAGARLRVPNVGSGPRTYDARLPPEWRQTLLSLNIASTQPKARRIVVDKSEGALKVYDGADKLVAQFPATMGSQYDPLPIGNWKIQGKSYNPKFHYNPSLFWDAKSGDDKAVLPPGPNGPVGVVWIDLNKPHYGIHGTPNPYKIGRTESHGCIRLTNWDAARLAEMVTSGTPAVFQK